MAIVSIIVGLMGAADVNTHINLLGIGLLALALHAPRKPQQSGGKEL